jgi:hypothetical protein
MVFTELNVFIHWNQLTNQFGILITGYSMRTQGMTINSHHLT